MGEVCSGQCGLWRGTTFLLWKVRKGVTRVCSYRSPVVPRTCELGLLSPWFPFGRVLLLSSHFKRHQFYCCPYFNSVFLAIAWVTHQGVTNGG